MTPQDRGCCRALFGPTGPIVGWLGAKGEYIFKVLYSWGGERVGVSFGIEQDFCFVFFPLLFCLSSLGGRGGRPGRLPRTGDPGQQAMGGFHVAPDVGGGGSLHLSPTPVFSTPLPPRAVHA